MGRDHSFEEAVANLRSRYPSPPPGGDPGVHERYLRNCARSHVEPYQLPASGLVALANALRRAEQRRRHEAAAGSPARDDGPGSNIRGRQSCTCATAPRDENDGHPRG